MCIIALSVALVACGGGGSGGEHGTLAATMSITPQTPNSTITGVFDGTTDANQNITALLQNDGSYFIVYSNTSTPKTVMGAIAGTGTLIGGSFSSSNGLDLNLTGAATQTPQAVTLSASYVQQQSLDGSLTYTLASKTTAFTAAYNSSYATLPSLAALAGDYTGSIATGNVSESNVILTIAQDGTLTGQLTCGCKINATLSTRKDGLAYVANLSMVGGDHILSNKTVAGNVFLDAAHRRLYIVGNIVGTNEAAIFVGLASSSQ
jgi:hypothetical protein